MGAKRPDSIVGYTAALIFTFLFVFKIAVDLKNQL